MEQSVEVQVLSPAPILQKRLPMKKVLSIQHSNQSHWVGDGFPVKSLLAYTQGAELISPFLLLDYAGPYYFPPSQKRLGVGSHPHRGFETVTIVYEGEVEHRDSAGAGGVIQNGDVQWMTAGSGLVHEEWHGKNFAKTGGMFEMVQLWVNLPKKDKMTNPRYQEITQKNIPQIELPHKAGTLSVIAGQYLTTAGAAKTFSPINLWNIKVHSGTKTELQVPDGHTALLLVIKGKINISDTHNIAPAEIAILDTLGDKIIFTALEESTLLFLGGQPLKEPVVGYGPFVMNTQEEIVQAIKDYQEGEMGMIP